MRKLENRNFPFEKPFLRPEGFNKKLFKLQKKFKLDISSLIKPKSASKIKINQ